MTDKPPRNNIDNIAGWAVKKGFKGLQVPSWMPELIDLDKCAKSKTYADEWKGKLKAKGLEVTDLYGLQGQMLAIHPAMEELFADFFPKGMSDGERVTHYQGELKKIVDASVNLGVKGIPCLSGGLAWNMVYPWPQRPPGLIEAAYRELARRWLPVLDYANEKGLTINYELHPGCDLFDGATYDRFLSYTNDHPAACINYDPSHFIIQCLDLYEFIKVYGSRIKGFHVKDGEFRPTAKCGVYGGMLPWKDRAGRFRSTGYGMVDFKRLFSLMTEAGYDGWAVLEWEDPVTDAEQGAELGAKLIEAHIIDEAEKAFDDFLGGKSDEGRNKRILGLK